MSSYMNSEFLESTVRLEANELQRHWDGSQNLGPSRLTLRIGDSAAGLIHAERTSAKEMKLTLDSGTQFERIQYLQVRHLDDAVVNWWSSARPAAGGDAGCFSHPDLVPGLRVSSSSARTVRFRDQVSREDQTNPNLVVVTPRGPG